MKNYILKLWNTDKAILKLIIIPINLVVIRLERK